MNGKTKKFWLGTGIAFGAVTLAIGGYGLSQIGKERPLTDSDYTEWVVTLAPTCEEKGLETRSLRSSPSVTQTREIPALGHSWGEWEEVTEATCLVDGVKKNECSTCHNYDYAPIPALGHDWGEWQTEKEADCLSEGYDTRVCKRDEMHTDYRVTEALGHDWSEWVITLPPTCTADGVETKYCRNCNDHTEVRAVEPLGHDWGPLVVTKSATCTDEGEQASFCRNDKTHVTTYPLEPLGHSYGDWVTFVAATESEDGEEIRYCQNDSSHTETRVLYAIGSLDCLTLSLYSDGSEYKVKCRSRDRVSGTVYIPAYYNGLPVTELADNGFVGCENLEEIVFLGNNLKTIGSNAFYGCSSLQSIELPEGVTTIKEGFLFNCNNLTSVTFPSTLVDLDMQYRYDYLGIQYGYVDLFRNCPLLESITVAEGNEAYKADGGCLIEIATSTLLAGTKNAVIPSYVTTIGADAFETVEVESIRIPASVSSIGYDAFAECAKLRDLEFENGESELVIRPYAFRNCTGLERVELPDRLIEIDRYVFIRCTSLREVIFGSNLQTIREYAFERCNAIQALEIPASVTSLNGASFPMAVFSSLTIAKENATYFKDGNCIIERETNVLAVGADDGIIPDYVTGIGDYAFYERTIESAVIPCGVQFIGAYAFRLCKMLQSVTFAGESQLESIGDFAFSSCTGLSEFVLPVTVESIGGFAFYNCTSLSEFVLPLAVKSIGNFAFYYSSVSSLTFAEGVSQLETIGASAFASMREIKTFIIPASVQQVQARAFQYWTQEQTIIVKGFASEEEAIAAWGEDWLVGCYATIIYEKE